ncbi:MAG: hypothetical protein K9M81_01105 [Chthoniobacterales bacterium]|nr:hypothetical protein [Chthoniobacterales bacterium]
MSLTQHPSGFTAYAVDRHEISGLSRIQIFHTKSIVACEKLIITVLILHCDFERAERIRSQSFTSLQ